jgi:hypothetical protein
VHCGAVLLLATGEDDQHWGAKLGLEKWTVQLDTTVLATAAESADLVVSFSPKPGATLNTTNLNMFTCRTRCGAACI